MWPAPGGRYRSRRVRGRGGAPLPSVPALRPKPHARKGQPRASRPHARQRVRGRGTAARRPDSIWSEVGFHYFPLGLPFLLLLGGLYVLLLVLLGMQVLTYAYAQMGLRPSAVLAVLLLSLLGSYINIPVFQLPGERVVQGREVFFAGMEYVVPVVGDWPR